MKSLRALWTIAILLCVAPLAFGQSLVNVREHRRASGPAVKKSDPGRVMGRGPRAISRPAGASLTPKPAGLTRPPCPDRDAERNPSNAGSPTSVDPTPARVYVTRHQVKIDIVDGVAVTEIDQTFHNDGTQVMEGTYVCPLPPNSVLDGLSIWMAGKEIQGSVMDVTRAREIYDRIVRRRKDPGIVELIPGRKRLIRVRIWPIPAKGDMRVKTRFAHILSQVGRHHVAELPLKSLTGPGVPAIREFGVHVQARASWPFLRAFSRGLDLEGKVKDDRCFFSGRFTAKDFRPKRDVSIRVAPELHAPRLALHVHRAGTGERFFMAVAAAGGRRLTGVRLRVDGKRAADVYPKPGRNMASGQQVLFFGRLPFSGDPEVVFEGHVRGRRFKEAATVKDAGTTAEKNQWVAGFWALARTQEILHEVRRKGVDQKTRKEIVDLGTRYGILTEYTAILAK